MTTAATVSALMGMPTAVVVLVLTSAKVAQFRVEKSNYAKIKN